MQQAFPSCNAGTGLTSEAGDALQDDTLAAQAALEKQLGAVGDDVEDISGKVAEVRCRGA